jgi:pimeloyl-ACP methyl ester carboxylesterase
VRAADRSDLVDAVQWTAIDGLRIRFIEATTRKGPDILILTPWPEGLAAYRDCWPLLVAAGRTVAIDLPGFGASEGRGNLASPRAMGEFLLKVIERFRLRHPHLVAPGIWWTLAVEVSVSEPGALESLIVSQDVMVGDRDATPSTRRPTRHELEREVRAAMAAFHVPQARQREILREFAASKFRYVAAYLQAHRAASRAAAVALSACPAPVLKIEGREDWTEIDRPRDGLAKSRSPIREEPPVGGSFAWIETPEVFGRLVANWVAAEYRRESGSSIVRVGTLGARNETSGGHDTAS